MMERLTAADGHELDCWMEPARGTARGGIVILQEIFGVTDQLKRVAARYAALGHDVAIPALFDRVERGAVIPFDDPARGRALMQACDPDATMRDVDAAVQALAAKGHRVGVIGFCWGGGLAIRAAQELAIACAVSFYGTRLEACMNAPLKAPVQGHWGTEDSHAPPETLAALRKTFPAMEIFTYDGAGHAFANDARPEAWDATAAETAHRRAEAFLARHLAT